MNKEIFTMEKIALRSIVQSNLVRILPFAIIKIKNKTEPPTMPTFQNSLSVSYIKLALQRNSWVEIQ